MELSLLCYPGSKRTVVRELMDFVPEDVDVVSPFFGGGSLEIQLANMRGQRVYGYDVFPPVANFWRAILSDPARVADMAAEHYPLDRDAFYAMSKGYMKCEDAFEQGVLYFILNRASWCGLVNGTSLNGKHKFTRNSIKRARWFRAPGLSVDLKCFTESIPAHPNEFMYVDPPYLMAKEKGYLYGEKGSTHKGFDHVALRDLLMAREAPWVLSYNDCEEVRALYEGCVFDTVSPMYFIQKTEVTPELVIRPPGSPVVAPAQLSLTMS